MLLGGLERGEVVLGKGLKRRVLIIGDVLGAGDPLWKVAAEGRGFSVCGQVGGLCP